MTDSRSVCFIHRVLRCSLKEKRVANINYNVWVAKLYNGIMIIHCCFRLLHDYTVYWTDCLTLDLLCLNMFLVARCQFLQGNVNLIPPRTDGLLSFYEAETLSLTLITDNECKRLCIATKKFNCLRIIFYSMTLGCKTSWKSFQNCSKAIQSARLWEDTLRWSARCNVCLS